MSSDPAVPLEEIASLPEFYHQSVSPDGSTVALYYDGSGRNEIHLIDRDTGDRERLTDGDVPRDASWWLDWADDGDRLYFHQDDAGDEQHDIHAADLDGNVEPVVEIDGQAMFLDDTDDALLFASDAGEQMNLYRYDHDTGQVTQLTDYDQPVRGGEFDPSGDQIAYIGNETRDLENTDVYVADADGSDPETIDAGSDGSETTLHGWFPDGDRLLISDNTTDLRQTGIYHLADGTTTWLGPNDAEESGVAVGPDGQRVLVSRQRRAATVPVVYDVETGEGRELSLPEGVASFHVAGGDPFADGETVVFGHSTAADRKRLLAYDLDAGDYEVLLDADYGDLDPSVFVDAEYVTYESEGAAEDSETFEVGGLLYDPRDGPARDSGETDLPGVVAVHGGPHARSDLGFNVYVQFAVSQGYAVFQPNYRGSTGRGRAFERSIHGDWGGDEQADVAEGGRWLMDRPWVDADRVAVFGGSYGGYSVYSQLTGYPDLWATGVAWVGITDLHRLYEEDMPHFQHQLRMQMGDPEENRDLWRDRSPIEHVDRMERPICIIHGVNDPRCPVEQARLFRDALRDRGWEEEEDFTYHELGSEGHGSTDIQQKIRAFRILRDYLDAHL